MGRAADVKPVSVPHVIARKHKPPVPPPTFVESISRPQKGKTKAQAVMSQNVDEYAVPIPTDDPVSFHISMSTILVVNVSSHRSKGRLPRYLFRCETECDSTNYGSLQMPQAWLPRSTSNLNPKLSPITMTQTGRSGYTTRLLKMFSYQRR